MRKTSLIAALSVALGLAFVATSAIAGQGSGGTTGQGGYGGSTHGSGGGGKGAGGGGGNATSCQASGRC